MSLNRTVAVKVISGKMAQDVVARERFLREARAKAAEAASADHGDDGRPIVSIAHEALLQSWPRLRNWIEENRDLLRVRGRVAAAAELWAEKDKLADLLLAEGKPLEDALPLLH